MFRSKEPHKVPSTSRDYARLATMVWEGVSVKLRSQMPADIQETSKSPTQQTPVEQSKKAIEITKDRLNISYKGKQAPIDKNIKKR